jgi:hypothetical protein
VEKLAKRGTEGTGGTPGNGWQPLATGGIAWVEWDMDDGRYGSSTCDASHGSLTCLSWDAKHASHVWYAGSFLVRRVTSVTPVKPGTLGDAWYDSVAAVEGNLGGEPMLCVSKR